MIISNNSAMQIVNEISKIVNQHINLMNQDGVIIASTDLKRMGNFHDIAKRMINEKLDVFYVEENMETEAVKRGFNLSIYNNEEIVGVIGITGEYDQVFKVGQIVRRMTEILMLDADRKMKKDVEKRALERFLDEWLRSDEICNLAFAERGFHLGVDITIPRRIVIISILPPNTYEMASTIENKDGEAAENQTLSYRKNPTVIEERRVDGTEEKIELANKIIYKIVTASEHSLVLRMINKTICIIAAKSQITLQALVNKIEFQLDNLHINLRIGIDSQVQIEADIRKNFTSAMKAWKACSIEKNIIYYDDVNLEIFLSDIKQENKEEYIRKIFNHSTEKKLKEWLELLELYFKHEGSISEISNEMFIHKNTLQYKIRKMHSLTGYDVRVPSDAAILYMAMVFLREEQNVYYQ